jgi:hypothetical protein
MKPLVNIAKWELIFGRAAFSSLALVGNALSTSGMTGQRDLEISQ